VVDSALLPSESYDGSTNSEASSSTMPGYMGSARRPPTTSGCDNAGYSSHSKFSHIASTKTHYGLGSDSSSAFAVNAPPPPKRHSVKSAGKDEVKTMKSIASMASAGTIESSARSSILTAPHLQHQQNSTQYQRTTVPDCIPARIPFPSKASRLKHVISNGNTAVSSNCALDTEVDGKLAYAPPRSKLARRKNPPRRPPPPPPPPPPPWRRSEQSVSSRTEQPSSSIRRAILASQVASPRSCEPLASRRRRGTVFGRITKNTNANASKKESKNHDPKHQHFQVLFSSAKAKGAKGHRKILSWAQGDLVRGHLIQHRQIGDRTSKLSIAEQLAVFRYLINSKSGILELLLEALQGQYLKEKGESLALRVLWMLLVTRQRLACAVDDAIVGEKFARIVEKISHSVSIDKILHFHTVLLALLTTPVNRLNSDVTTKFKQRDKKVHNSSIWPAVLVNLAGSHMYPRLHGMKDVLYLLLKNPLNCETVLSYPRWQVYMLMLIFDIPSTNSTLAGKCKAYIITIINTLHWHSLTERNLIGFASVIRTTITAVLAPCHPDSIYHLNRLILSLINTAAYNISHYTSDSTPHLNSLWTNTIHLVKMAEMLTLQTPSAKLYLNDPTAKEYEECHELKGLDDAHLLHTKRLCLHALQIQDDNSKQHRLKRPFENVGGGNLMLDQRALVNALQHQINRILVKGATKESESARARSRSAASTSRASVDTAMNLRSVGPLWASQLDSEVALLKKTMLFLQQLRISSMTYLGEERNSKTKQVKTSVEDLLKEIPFLGEATAFISLLQERYMLLQERDVWFLLTSYATTKDAKSRRRVFRQYEKIVDKKDIDRVYDGRKFQLLFLGQHGSGRSTLRKQLMRTFGYRFGDERTAARHKIFAKMIISMRCMIYHCKRLYRLAESDMSLGESETLHQLCAMLNKSGRHQEADKLSQHIKAMAQYHKCYEKYRMALREAEFDFKALDRAYGLAEHIKAKEKEFLPKQILQSWTKQYYVQFNFTQSSKEYVRAIEAAYDQLLKDGKESVLFTMGIGKAIDALWRQKNVKLAYSFKTSFTRHPVDDSAAYFFDRALSIANQNQRGKYCPSDEDIVRCKDDSSKEPIQIDHMHRDAKMEITLLDIEKTQDEANSKRWVKYLTKRTLVFYVVDLSTYTTRDNEGNNMLRKELFSFGSLCQDPTLSMIPIIIIFNKIDVFQDLLKYQPFTACFPDLSLEAGSDVSACIEHLSQKFRSKGSNVGAQPRKIMVHAVNASDKRTLDPVVLQFKGYVDDVLVEDAVLASGQM